MTSPSPAISEAAVGEAAARLLSAASSRTPCAPVRDVIGTDDVHVAYAVQRAVNSARLDAGARVVGRKIGLTSEAVQLQLGVDQPDFGVLFEDMSHDNGSTVPVTGLLQPRVEAEIAFVLGADLVDGDLSVDQVRRSVDHVVAAVEIVDSRVAGWDISFADTVADNASSGAFVLGTTRRPLSDIDTVGATMRLSIDDVEVSTGIGSACLGDPVNALAWLAATVRDLGDPLRAGQVVLAGALGPMAPAGAGSKVVADIDGLGEVSFRFAEVEG